MSSASKNSNMNDRGSSEKNDTQRGNEGAQSQDASRHQQDAAHHQPHKSPKQGATDNKSGQQSQGASRKDTTDGKGSDSGKVSHDQKPVSEAGQKSGASKQGYVLNVRVGGKLPRHRLFVGP
ncbi:MAG: hypothetical protein ACYDBZ_12280 [Steroidobacteraceae bacterium]